VDKPKGTLFTIAAALSVAFAVAAWYQHYSGNHTLSAHLLTVSRYAAVLRTLAKVEKTVKAEK